MSCKLAVFDLDGTLFDTEPVNFLAYRQALARFGLSLSRADFAARACGRGYRDFLPELTGGRLALTEPIHDLKKSLYPLNLDQARPNRLLIDLAAMMKSQGCRLALATTASRKNCDDLLTFFKMNDFFDLVLSGEDVALAKPSPEVFQKAMAHFQIKPEDTVIFEDSPAGREAAGRSGATVFLVDRFN